MARTRASDYDDKRRVILDHSAELFAEYGYDRASMNMIAAACGVSKANLYHYYPDKAALLFDIIRFHLEELCAAVETAAPPDMPPDERLRRQIAALLDAYRDADAQHAVQINSLRLLSPERQAELKALERALVDIFSGSIAVIAPHLKTRKLLKPVTMSLFGMLNWHYLWFKDNGPMTRTDYADLVADLILDGTHSLGAAKSNRLTERSARIRAKA